ncbi:MAG: HAMP domain-containing histidine kinase [Lachnospiraceae bacterium]|nr:HAMP domain-containing histidine kinase [Lachnospiraceae bacterium]
MKKIGLRRALLCILLHLLLGTAFLLISYLFLNSAFTISYLDGDKVYQLQAYANSNEAFEDSSLYTEIYTKQLQDIIALCAVRNEIEAKGASQYNNVNIIEYVEDTDFASGIDKKVVYSVDDLIKWGRQGYTYTRQTFTLDEFMKFYDSDIPFDMIRAGVSDGITYTSGSDGITEVTVTLLNAPFETVGGVSDITKLADDWLEYFKIRDSIIYTSERFADYYENYKNGMNLYGNYPINLHYVVRVGEGNKRITYTNCDDMPYDISNLSDEELNEIFADQKDYIIYYPNSLEFLTFSNVNESDLYTYVRLYSDELSDHMSIWAYVGDDSSLSQDAFVRSKSVINNRKNDVKNQSIAIICLLIAWIGIFVFLLFKAGVKKDGSVYSVFWDSIWIEIYLVFFVLMLVITNVLFTMSRGAGSAKLMVYGDLAYYSLFVGVGIIDSAAAGMLFFSFVRRIRNHTFANNSLLMNCYSLFTRVRDKIEQSDNPYISGLLPFNLFLVLNYFLIFVLIQNFMDKKYVLFAIFCIVLLGVDIYAAIRQFRRISDHRNLFRGIKRISDGELDYKVDKSNMLEINEEFADAVNNVGDGIRQAVSNSMKDEKMRSDLITNVSHDLKTPLTSIINYVDLLKSEKINQEPAAGYINTLQEKSVRLKQLLEDLIEASRLSSGSIEINPQSLGINELLRQVVGEYTDKLDDKKLTVIYCGDVSSPIYADGRLMWRIMDNLFGNIIKYSLMGTRVYINFEEAEDRVNVSIKNVSAEPNTLQGNELTEKFIRGDSSRSTEGTGLGLFIAKNLTELQGGTFEVIADGDLFKVNMSYKKA